MYKSIVSLAFLLTCAPSVNAEGDDKAGKTIMVKGGVTALDISKNSQRSLKRRDPIFGFEKVLTESEGRAQFAMVDGGLLSVKPNSEVQIASYQYDETTKKGSAVIELVKGGLRSISGQIKQHGGDYQIKTPVGSIGIRGTHFELELVDDEMFIAVWDGTIELTMDGPQGLESPIAFGADQPFSFGKISADGDVTQFVTAPEVFANGHTVSLNESSSEPLAEPDSVESNLLSDDSSNVGDVVAIASQPSEDELYQQQQFLVESNESVAELIATRTGEFNYSTVTQSDVFSTAGAVSDFNISMTVDFDNGLVNDGELTATDAGGDWYAAFSGFIDVTELDLAVTFAAHGNEKAEGNIDAIFTDNSDSITGQFDLTEVNNPLIRLNGIFVVE